MKKKFTLAILSGTICLIVLSLGRAKDKMSPPVDTERSFDRANFLAGYDQVWDVTFKLLSGYGFEFATKDKNLGRMETGYVILSRNPRFSKLTNGFKTYAAPPRLFLRKWQDGKIRISAHVKKLDPSNTQVTFHPEIYGFAAVLSDDSGVTGEWRPCQSNGKFEFELLNEIATELRKGNTATSITSVTSEVPSAGSSVEAKEPQSIESSTSSTLVFDSVPPGAEIFLNNQLVGMTPSRLSVAPGKYKVLFKKKGFKIYQRDFVVMETSDLTISTELEKK